MFTKKYKTLLNYDLNNLENVLNNLSLEGWKVINTTELLIILEKLEKDGSNKY